MAKIPNTMTPKTLKDWFLIFEGDDIASFRSISEVRNVWAREIWEHLKIRGNNKRQEIKVMDGSYGQGGWVGKYLAWLQDEYDYEFGSASTTFFLNKPTKP
jgi:hypothetical protein